MTPGLSRLRVGQMLPDIDLTVVNGAPMPVRSPYGETTVILWRHAFECDACEQYLKSVASLEEEFRVWDARLLVVAPSNPHSSVTLPFGRTTTGEQLAPEGAGVLVADRYGQIFYTRHADAGHDFPTPQELAEWLKHLGTLCPE